MNKRLILKASRAKDDAVAELDRLKKDSDADKKTLAEAQREVKEANETVKQLEEGNKELFLTTCDAIRSIRKSKSQNGYRLGAEVKSILLVGSEKDIKFLEMPSCTIC